MCDDCLIQVVGVEEEDDDDNDDDLILYCIV
jgi:hypothetical protein